MSLDYRLRTHKQIERNILINIINGMTDYSPELYSYIGFGAEYFKDFIMLHDKLNISVMKSIERNTSMKKKYEFNKPYKECIEMLYGDAKEKLATFKYEPKSIFWLDFTDAFSDRILDEVMILLTNIELESLALFTFNIERPLEQDVYEKFFFEYLPNSLSKKSYSKKEYPVLVRKTMDNIIGSILKKRGKEYSGEKFFDFVYSDGAKMITIGYSVDLMKNIEKYKNNLKNNIFAFKDEYYNLNIDTITPDELFYLRKIMPGQCNEVLPWCNNLNESKRLVEKFKDIYQYYPLFAEFMN